MNSINSLNTLLVKKLAVRDHSEFELRSYAEKKGFSNDEINSVIEELKTFNYVCDDRFCLQAINRYIAKLDGPMRITHRLKTVGISHEKIKKHLNQTNEFWNEKAYQWLIKNFSSRKEPTMTSIINSLRTKGYYESTIYQASHKFIPTTINTFNTY